MNTIKLRINSSDFTFDQVKNEADIKFIAFEYIIPRPLFPPVKRISKLYCVGSAMEKPSPLRYNFPNFLFCWFGLPFGPISAFAAYKKNRKGIDFTKDVKLNLKKEDFQNGYVMIEKLEEIFVHPDKSTLKELTKALNKYISINGDFDVNPIIGYYIETESPSYYLGLSKTDLSKSENVLEMIYKYFYKHTKFNIINLEETSELITKLIEQGKEMTLASN